MLLGKDLRTLGALARARSSRSSSIRSSSPLLVGLVARFAADRPRVAFVDQDGIPETLVVGGQSFDVNGGDRAGRDRGRPRAA